jgi:hypothetical protein
MKVTKITVTFGGKVNTGNYSNVDIAVTHEVELAEGENPVDVTVQALKRVKALAVSEVKALNSRQTEDWLRVMHNGSDDNIPY